MLFYHNMGLCFVCNTLLNRNKAQSSTTIEKRVCSNFSKKWLNVKEDSVKNLVLLINRPVYLVVLSFKITLFPI